MAIKRTQQWEVYGITTGDLPEKELEQICCPLLDGEGSGRPNFPLQSCLSRQKDTEWKLPTCYKGCKGKRQRYNKPQIDPVERARRRAERGLGVEAAAIKVRIFDLHKEGMSAQDIAVEVGRGKSLVEKRLVEAGLVVPRGYGPVSLRQTILSWIDKNPECKAKDVYLAFPETPKGTCESYLAQWKKRKRS